MVRARDEIGLAGQSRAPDISPDDTADVREQRPKRPGFLGGRTAKIQWEFADRPPLPPAALFQAFNKA